QMGSVKLKILSAALLTVAAVTAGMGVLSQQPARQEPVATRPAELRLEPRTDLYGDPLPEGAVARIGTSRLRDSAGTTVIAFSQDGRRLAYGNENGLIHVCEAADGKPLFDLQPDKVH